jgi:hypothetical protein
MSKIFRGQTSDPIQRGREGGKEGDERGMQGEKERRTDGMRGEGMEPPQIKFYDYSTEWQNQPEAPMQFKSLR